MGSGRRPASVTYLPGLAGSGLSIPMYLCKVGAPYGACISGQLQYPSGPPRAPERQRGVGGTIHACMYSVRSMHLSLSRLCLPACLPASSARTGRHRRARVWASRRVPLAGRPAPPRATGSYSVAIHHPPLLFSPPCGMAPCGQLAGWQAECTHRYRRCWVNYAHMYYSVRGGGGAQVQTRRHRARPLAQHSGARSGLRAMPPSKFSWEANTKWPTPSAAARACRRGCLCAPSVGCGAARQTPGKQSSAPGLRSPPVPAQVPRPLVSASLDPSPPFSPCRRTFSTFLFPSRFMPPSPFPPHIAALGTILLTCFQPAFSPRARPTMMTSRRRHGERETESQRERE